MATTGTHLLGGRLNLTLIREAARAELKEILGDSSVQKVIIWDEPLIGPIGLIAEVPFLLSLGVSKMIRLPVKAIAQIDTYKEAQEFVFIVRPQLHVMEGIIEAILPHPPKSKQFTVVFVPQKSVFCVNRLESEKLSEISPIVNFRIKEFHLDMLPLENDVISLNIETAFTDLYLYGDPSPLHQAARSIAKLQILFGVIPRIYAKGKYAKAVADLMEKTHRQLQQGRDQSSRSAPQIDAIILLDRSVDFMTPLCTQLTYEGLIDEVFGIKYTSTKFPREMFSEEVQQPNKKGPTPTGPLVVALNSDDNTFGHMRDLNFRAVGGFLAKKAKEISAAFQERHDAKTVQQLKQFVQNLPHMQQEKLAISKHTTIAELLKMTTDSKGFRETIYCEQGLRVEDGSDRADDFIEKCLGQLTDDSARVLRLMCLQSQSNGGLKPKLMDRYRQEIIQRYGTHHLISLHHLEKTGLLRVQEGKGFPYVKRALNLNVSSIDELNPKDTSYVFSGYAPLSVRLVEQVDKPLAVGWQTNEDLMRLIPGPTVIRSQPVAKGYERRKKPTPDQPQVVLVFFLGGCSYAEISALRYLTQREEAVTDYIIGTTNITTANKLVNGILKETPLAQLASRWDPQQGSPKPTHSSSSSSSAAVGKASKRY